MKTRRDRLIVQIHIAKKDLALDEDTYRLMLEGVTGKRSCRQMSERQLAQVVASMKEKGWRPRNPRSRRKVSPPSRHKDPGQKTEADKIRALWIDMHKMGIVADGGERALGRYCYRMVGKYSPDWLTGWEASQIIEALKQWRARYEEA